MGKKSPAEAKPAAKKAAKKAAATGAVRLTVRQELFARSVASGMNQSDAYREAYTTSGMKPSSINVNASKLMAVAKIRQRVDEIRAPAVKRAQVTLEAHLEDLKDLREDARKVGQYSAAISAEVARGRASGLYTERVEHSGEINIPAPTIIINADDDEGVSGE